MARAYCFDLMSDKGKTPRPFAGRPVFVDEFDNEFAFGVLVNCAGCGIMFNVSRREEARKTQFYCNQCEAEGLNDSYE